jgi:hypothetical protein
LIEGFAFSAIHKPLQNQRTILNPKERARRNGKIIAYDIKLGEFCLARKVKLVRMRDPNFAACDRERLSVVLFAPKTRLA